MSATAMNIIIGGNKGRISMPRFAVGQDVYLHNKIGAFRCTVREITATEKGWVYTVYTECYKKEPCEYEAPESVLTMEIHQKPQLKARIEEYL